MSFFIDNVSYNMKNKDLTILQVCEQNKIVIPRFCYHEKLSIAGNCRMCLVELENSPKPIASCALPINDNIKIFTESMLVKKAREGILEFLLINHPLDCPICDWGGECDLQDQTQIFGGDRGRFYEEKRSVSDKNCGPLIKTYMTRCIHCTRCVRYFTEVAGMPVFGTTGRGSKMEISAYISEVFNSEISGNLIDLCPVGALTSKPSAFSGRPWDFDSFKTIDPFDGLGSSIQIDFHGRKIARILPVINEYVNEEWISDKCRFSFDAYKVQRLIQPYIKQENKSLPVSWKSALNFIERNIKKSETFIGMFGPLVDLETLLSLKYFFCNLGKFNLINYEKPLYFSNIDFRNSYFFDFRKIKKIKYETCLLVGLDLKKENAVLNARFRQYCLKNDTKLGSIGPNSVTNFEILKLGYTFNTILDIINGKNYFSFYLLKSKKILILVGPLFFENKEGFLYWNELLKYKVKIKEVFNIELDLFFISPSLSIMNALEVGAFQTNNQKFFKLLEKKKKFFYLLNTNDNVKVNNFGYLSKNDFIVYQGHHGNSLAMSSNVILPSPNFLEKTGHFVTLQGYFEKATDYLTPLGFAQSDLEIFKILAKRLNFFNFLKLNFGLFTNYKYLFFLNSNLPYLSLKDIYYQKNSFNFYKIKYVLVSPHIFNFWMTDPITSNSMTLALTSKFLESLNNFEK